MGRDYFERIDGHAHVTTGGGTPGEPLAKLPTITPGAPAADVLALLSGIREQLDAIELSRLTREEASNELQGAEIQLGKVPPDKEAIARKLRSAVDVIGRGRNIDRSARDLCDQIRQVIEWARA